MAALLISFHRILFFLVLVQAASLYKIYASDDNRPNLLSHSVSSPFDEENNQRLSINDLGYDDDVVYDTNIGQNKDNLAPWLSLVSEMKQQQKPMWKRSASMTPRSVKPLPQRRNSRPHWNPLVAAYKRCGELSTREERETCFKDAVQMLFVHKLRK